MGLWYRCAVPDQVFFLQEGAAASSKGRALAPINLSQYVHSTGSRISNNDVQSRYKLDYELFSNKLKTVRGWGPKQIEMEWLRLKSDPQVKKDELGRHHPTYGTLRIYVPPELIGEDFEQDQRGTFEERRVDSTHKATANFRHLPTELVSRSFGSRAFLRLGRMTQEASPL